MTCPSSRVSVPERRRQIQKRQTYGGKSGVDSPLAYVQSEAKRDYFFFLFLRTGLEPEEE